MTETNKPLNIKQAAEFIGVTRSYMYALVHYCKIPAYKPGGKTLYFKQSDLENYVFRNRQSADYELREKADGLLV